MFFCGEMIGGLQIATDPVHPASPYAAPLPNDIVKVESNELLIGGFLDRDLTGRVGELTDSYVLAERHLDLRVFIVLHNPQRLSVGYSYTHQHEYLNKGVMDKKFYQFDILQGKDLSGVRALIPGFDAGLISLHRSIFEPMLDGLNPNYLLNGNYEIHHWFSLMQSSASMRSRWISPAFSNLNFLQMCSWSCRSRTTGFATRISHKGYKVAKRQTFMDWLQSPL